MAKSRDKVFWATCEHPEQITHQIFLVLANPHLPSLRALASAVPANKNTLAISTPHKLNGSHKAWHRMIVRNGQ
jgi:hypothetical protein